MDGSDRRRAAIGALAAGLWVAGSIAVAPLAGGAPLVALAQLVIEVAPGPVATAGIELFGSAAQPLLVATVAGATLATGAALGWGWPRLPLAPRPRAGAALGLLAAVTVVLGIAGGGPPLRAVAAGLLAVVPVGAVAWLLRPGGAPARGRRAFLRWTGAGVGTVAGIGGVSAAVGHFVGDDGSSTAPEPGEAIAGKTTTGRTVPDTSTATGTAVAAAAATATARSSPDERMATDVRKEGRVTVSTKEGGGPFGFGFEGMPDRVTDPADHYVVDKNVTDPEVDPGSWSLDVGGHVDAPYSLSIGDLLDHPEQVDRAVTMACISNPVGGELISTGRWRGVPVAALLEAAGVRDGAVDVVTRAVDGYSEAIPYAVVRERDDILLAFGLGGETLPAAHGFPARLLIPGRYGMKSTKWVTAIEVATSEHDAYWERRGWDEAAVVNTLSYVRAAQRRGDRVGIGGVAYAGTRGIERVEVSLDGGPWREADLEPAVSDLAWRRWRRVVERPAGSEFAVVVRAIDGSGTVQTRERRPPHPSGSTGWHRVTFTL